MILITEKDILKCVTHVEMVNAIEESFITYEKKDFNMPHRMHIDHGVNTFLIMPCFGSDYFATKLVTIYPDNTGTDVPVLNGVIVLNDLHTGLPLAMMNGVMITAIRTGAVGGVGVKHLSKENATTLGIIGAGVQAYHQIMASSAVRNLQEITILDINQENSRRLAEKVKESLPNVITHVATDAEELLQKSEIVITTTTSKNPVLPENKELLRGKSYVGVGSFKPDIREFPESLYSLVDKVYIDTEHAKHETGDILYPLENNWIKEDQLESMGRIIISSKEGKASINKETTFFKSVGMALFDLVAAQLVYEKAIEKGLGQKINI